MISGKPYVVTIKRSAERELDRLPALARDQIAAELLRLETNPRPHGCKRLRGQDEYRIRIGSYRALYTIDDLNQVVEIAAVGHRRDVYRNLS